MARPVSVADWISMGRYRVGASGGQCGFPRSGVRQVVSEGQLRGRVAGVMYSPPKRAMKHSASSRSAKQRTFPPLVVPNEGMAAGGDVQSFAEGVLWHPMLSAREAFREGYLVRPLAVDG